MRRLCTFSAILSCLLVFSLADRVFAADCGFADGCVFLDSNCNGIFDKDTETGIDGVIVHLIDGEGAIVDSTVTSSETFPGYYFLANGKICSDLPGPALILVHVASVWVPFTSESKEAVADYDAIVKEIRLALQDCGRQLGAHVRRRKKEAEAVRKRQFMEKYIPFIGEALQEILSMSDKKRTNLEARLSDLLERSRK